MFGRDFFLSPTAVPVGARAMRGRMAVFAVTMLLALAASAAEPNMSGVWVYTAKDSYWSTSDLPANFSLTIDMRLSADKIEYSSVNDSDKSKIGRLSFVAPLDGTRVPLGNQARYNQVSVKRTGPGELEIVQYLNGDVIVASFYTFRDDGMTMVRRGVGKSPEGKSKAYQEYFLRK